LATKLGKDRTTIANVLRLLKLPQEVRAELLQNRITPGHARAILSLDTREKQKELCALILQKDFSVREAEALARRWSEKPKRRLAPGKERGELESQLESLQDSLRRHLGTKVHFAQRGKRGKIEIEYYSKEDLERIIEAILGKNA
jgi:ParB family chromosome partitioning protein